MKLISMLSIALISAIAMTSVANAQPSGSILIWPVDPVIEPTENATALWLENPGKTKMTLQVRVYAWAQQDGRNVYAEQNDVMGTPPILTIEPGQRQLVRLTRMVPTPAESERAFRVIVDEIPTRTAADTALGASVSFRMRYSMPLFAYAKGVTQQVRKNRTDPRSANALSWRIVAHDGERFLEVANAGQLHARLVDVSFQDRDVTSPVAKGLLGYVLPGTSARWPLPDDVKPSGTLVATLNGVAASAIPIAVN